MELTPCFGDKADKWLTKANSFEYTQEFCLDKYFDKELFCALEFGEGY